jgi:hypothetical protein
MNLPAQFSHAGSAAKRRGSAVRNERQIANSRPVNNLIARKFSPAEKTQAGHASHIPAVSQFKIKRAVIPSDHPD